MMKAKPVKPRTASVGDEKPSDVELEANNSKDYQDSDSLSEDEADDAPNDLAFSHELNSPKFSKKFDHETQNIKRNYAKEPKVVKTQVFNNFSSQKQSDYKRNYYFYIPIVVLILAIAASSYAWSSNSTEKFKETPQSEIVLLRNLENNIDSISNKFKQQDGEIWDEIISGVSEVVKHPDKLGIIFLFSQDDYLMNCLAKMIGNASKAALGSSEELMLSPSQLGKNRGYVIDKFKDEITRQKIVIVDNLLDVNPDAMMDFHHLCDRETPLVTRVLYILTMVAKGFDGKKENPLIFVENQLKLKLHNQIDQDKVDPLITRLTDGIIFPIQPEPDFKSCPLRY
ncbi:torsin interacting protein isoform X2 [Cotesia typhae]